MNLKHHPDADILLSYASGASPEAVSLAVAGHLTFCGECRRSLRALESAGGRMLSDLEPASLTPGALEKVLGSLNQQDLRTPASKDDGSVPAPLRPYVGDHFETLRWRRLAPGIAYYPFTAGAGHRVQLIRAAAGHGVARHSHRGREMTLVLQGGFSDETGQYSVGDFQTASSDITHMPVADADGACVILGVTDAPLVFSGLLPRLIGKLAGF